MPSRGDVVRLAIRALREVTEQGEHIDDVRKILRGPELEYLCYICAVLQDLGMCDDLEPLEDDYDGD